MTTPVPTAGAPRSRSSLACLPCRSKHLKCDGVRPCCRRCTEGAQECQYAPSRRGGQDRAALAERRKRRAGAANATAAAMVEDWSSQETARTQVGLDLSLPFTDANLNGSDLLGGVSLGNSTSSVNLRKKNIENDILIDSYYDNFHSFHPFVMPRRHMTRHYQDPKKQSSLRPLIAAMCLVGHIYHFREWSALLQDHVENCFAQAGPLDPIIIPARLLYSIALFWYDHKNKAKDEADRAIGLAVDLHLFREEFAAEHGADDPVLRESWRRTWWMLYIVDAYYAGTLGTMELQVLNIDATVGLPCEEREYESGAIPKPKTFHDFDCREFALEPVDFSSFSYLIGAIKCAGLAISSTPKRAVKQDSVHVIQAADSAIDAWLLLLPKDRVQVVTSAGKIDELMFQAHLVIRVSTIGIHRPFSDLKFNPVEGISSCARAPPPDNPVPDLVNVHTIRVLRSVEAQIGLLALPVRPFCHTPFTTCMVSEGTLALLSACHFLLKGHKLAIAREQIRLTIGCLRALGETWPRTARNVREIQTIAQHVLGLRSTTAGNDETPSCDNVPPLSGGDGQSSLGSEGGTLSNDNDGLPLLSSIDDLCGWYDFGDLGHDFSQ